MNIFIKNLSDSDIKLMVNNKFKLLPLNSGIFLSGIEIEEILRISKIWKNKILIKSKRDKMSNAVDNRSKKYTISKYISHSKNLKRITDCFKTGDWNDSRCFITAGGHSLSGFDFDLLKNELTIGINRTLEYYSPTIFYSMDIRFARWCKEGILGKLMKDKWEKYSDYKVFLSPYSNVDFDDSDVYYINRTKKNSKKKISFVLEDGLVGGNNSGYGAIELAICLGANPIYLLGFDMNITSDNKIRFHDGYPNDEYIDKNRIKEFYEGRFSSYINKLNEVANTIASKNFKIVNLNKNSALKIFEFGNIKDILNEYIT